MALAQDILLEDDWDLQFANGDFLIGASDSQHLALITEMDIGHLKENPFLGIGIRRRLGGSDTPAQIKSDMEQMYIADNYTVNSIVIKNGEIFNVDTVRL